MRCNGGVMRCNGGVMTTTEDRDRDNDACAGGVCEKVVYCHARARARYFENACSQPDLGGGNEKLSARYV